MRLAGALKPVILLALEDGPQANGLRIELEEEGFEVRHEVTRKGALQLVRERAVHFSVIGYVVEQIRFDKPLTHDLETAYDGGALGDYQDGRLLAYELNEIWKQKGDQGAHVIWDWRPAADEGGPSMICVQSASEAAIKVKHRLHDETPYNWQLEIQDSLGDDIRLDLPSGAVTGDSLEQGLAEALLRLCPNDKKIAVTKLPHQGHSGALLFSVVPIRDKDVARSFVLKLQSAASAKKELDRFERLVLTSNLTRIVRVHGLAMIVKGTVGALKYEAVRGARQLEEFLPSAHKDLIASVIGAAFAELGRTWYRKAFPSEQLSNSLAHFSVAQVRPWLEQAFAPADRASELVPGYPVGGLQDVPDELRGLTGQMCVIPHCTVHGDLHLRNILVGDDDSIQADSHDAFTIIDFSETDEERPLYVDFAKLEIDAAMRLIPRKASLAQITSYVRWCLDEKQLVPKLRVTGLSGKLWLRLRLVVISVRSSLRQQLEELPSDHALTERQVLECYQMSLLAELVQYWRWLPNGYGPEARSLNLLSCRTLLDRYKSSS